MSQELSVNSGSVTSPSLGIALRREEAELARMGYKQELKYVYESSSLGLPLSCLSVELVLMIFGTQEGTERYTGNVVYRNSMNCLTV